MGCYKNTKRIPVMSVTGILVSPTYRELRYDLYCFFQVKRPRSLPEPQRGVALPQMNHVRTRRVKRFYVSLVHNVGDIFTGNTRPAI